MLADSMKSSRPTNIRQKAASDRDAIYTSIVKAITKGEFPEGSKLPTERELSEKFDAARYSVRLALDVLVREGSVSRQVGRGTFVTGRAATDTAHSMQEPNFTLQEILEVRLLIEPQIPRLLTDRLEHSHFVAMDRCLAGIRGSREWSEYKEWKYELHLTIVRATGNRLLVRIFEDIIRSRRQNHWGRTANNGIIPDDVRAATLLANEAIVDALREGSFEEAGKGIRRYLNEIIASFHGI